MTMTKIINKFNVAKYNEKINTLNKIIDTFNDTISNFSCWMDITPALVKELIYNPVKTHHKYLSFEKIVQYRCSEYETLLFVSDKLRKEAYAWKNRYLAEFGDLITAVFEQKIACIKKKKSISFCQMAVNRGKPVDQADLQSRFIQI